MIPTHKDLIIIKTWFKEPYSNTYNEIWHLYGEGLKLLGEIRCHNQNSVYLRAKLFNKEKDACFIPLKSPVFNYLDYIPEWEKCMDDLLATIFK